MVSENNEKLTEIIRLCAENQLRVTFTQYGDKKNSIERTIEMGEDVVIIQIGDTNDPELSEILDNFLLSIKG